MVILRGHKAIAAFRGLGLDELWESTNHNKKQLEEIAARSRVIDDDTEAVGVTPVAGLWKNGWIESQLASGSKQILSISRYDGAVNVDLSIEAAKIENNVLRFQRLRLASLLLNFPEKADQQSLLHRRLPCSRPLWFRVPLSV